MRRKDRQMDEAFALDVIDKSEYGFLALVNEDKPLSRVLTFVRQDRTLYFHSAREGEKIHAFVEGMDLELVFVTEVKVPRLYSKDQVRKIVEDGQAATLLSKVYTTEFSSAMVKGKLRMVQDQEEIELALRLVSDKYTPEMNEFIDVAIEVSRDRVAVFAVDIDEIKGKRKKFDKEGEEMKWGRKEKD